MNLDYRLFIVNDCDDSCELKTALNKLPFPAVINCSSSLANKNSETAFYTLLRTALSSDSIVVDIRQSATVVEGSIMMLAKMYKIPIYLLSNSDNKKETRFYACQTLCTKCFRNEVELFFYMNEIYQNNKIRIIHKKINTEDVLLKLDAFDAGYDIGYSETLGFWGTRPANYVQMAADALRDKKNVNCIDLGCGTGKNSIYLQSCGFEVEAIDASYYAIVQAKALSSEVVWKTRDVRKWKANTQSYDLVVMTGLLHCYATEEEIINTVNEAKKATKPGGYNVISVFNNEVQDLSGHAPDFVPMLLPHQFYLNLYDDWKVVASSDTVLDDEHPNNNIKHKHSITRILVQKNDAL